mgnify:CR=1 FL=1
MEVLIYLSSLPIVERLGWVLFHFLWQGALIGFVCALVLRTVSAQNVRVAYLVTISALLLCGLSPVVTFYFVDSSEVSGFETRGETTPENASARNALFEETLDIETSAEVVFIPEAKPFIFSN